MTDETAEATAPNVNQEQAAVADLAQSNSEAAETGVVDAPANTAKNEKAGKGKSGAKEAEAAPIDYAVPIPEAFAEKIKADDPIFGAMGEVLGALAPDATTTEAVKSFIGGLMEKLDGLGVFDASDDPANFDLAKELQGFENGVERSEALGAKIEALKARNDLTAEEAAEIGSLSLSPAGITALEKVFGKGEWKDVDPPKQELPSKEAAMKEWKAIFADDRWNANHRWMQEQEPRMIELRAIIDGQ